MGDKKRYSVDMVRDDAALLRDRLGEIANEGGRVISVMWLPEPNSFEGVTSRAGYTVVAEHG